MLSHFQAEPLLRARKQGKASARISLDLGLTESEVVLTAQGVKFPTGDKLPWSEIEHMLKQENRCWWVEDGEAHPVQVFSETTNWVRSLMATEGAPTTLVAGLAMHRIKGIDPRKDTLLKIKAAAPIVGRVLDTATGLGYTAIEAARTAEEVVTIELDPAGLEVARFNPWSRDLFTNPKIKQLVGDAVEVVPTLESGSFARILHDPPAFSLGGELYSTAFYRELFRVLTRSGKLFHYIGDLDSKSGRVVTKGVLQRLEQAGFGRIVRRPEAFGVVAQK